MKYSTPLSYSILEDCLFKHQTNFKRCPLNKIIRVLVNSFNHYGKRNTQSGPSEMERSVHWTQNSLINRYFLPLLTFIGKDISLKLFTKKDAEKLIQISRIPYGFSIRYDARLNLISYPVKMQIRAEFNTWSSENTSENYHKDN